MSYCTIPNTVDKQALTNRNINVNEFTHTLDLIADIVAPDTSINVIDGVSFFAGNNSESIDMIAKFLEHPYHRSFIEFVNKNSYLKNHLRKNFEVTRQNSNANWEAFVKSFYTLKGFWDKYAKKQSYTDKVAIHTINNSPFLCRYANMAVLNNDKNKKYEGYDYLDNIVNSILNTDFNALTNALIKEISFMPKDLKDIISSCKNLGIDISAISLDMSKHEFDAVVDNAIKRSITRDKILKNNREKLYNLFLKIADCNKNLRIAYNNNLESKKREYSRKRTQLYKELNSIPRAELEATLRSQLLNKDDYYYDLIKQSLSAVWTRNFINKKSDNGQLTDEEKKTISGPNINNPFFPWFESNVIEEKEWDKLKKVVANGITIRDLYNKYRKDNDLLSEFLNGISSQSNPIVKIITLDNIPDGKLKKQIDNFKRNHGHVPASIYATATANKELGGTSECIYIIDDGTSNHSFSIEALTHEWLHALTTSTLYKNGEIGESLDIVRKHCLDLYQKGNVDMKGIDRSKLNEVPFGSGSIPYAFYSNEEFLAEAFNNTEVQKLLQRIKSPFKEKKKKSLFDWLVEKIQKFVNKLLKSVGAKITDHTALVEVIMSGSAIMNLTLIKDQSRFEEVTSDTEYGVHLNPLHLNEMDDFTESIIDEIDDFSGEDKDLINGCNNVITPSLTTDINDSDKFNHYNFNDDFIDTYNEKVTDEDSYINNTNYSDNTVAAVHIKNDIFQFGQEERNNAINNAITCATKILNLGGRVVTFSKSYLESNLFANRANILIYNNLLNSGYTPHEIDNRVIWTQEKISNEEKEQFLLDAKKIDKLNPSVEIIDDKCIIRPDGAISEEFSSVREGAFTFYVNSDNPLYNDLSMINKGVQLQVHNDNLYHGKVTNIETTSNKSLKITFDLHISQYSNVNTEDFDEEMFESTNPVVVSNPFNMYLKLGIKQAKWRINMIAQDMLNNIAVLANNVELPDIIGLEDNEQTRISYLFQTTTYDSICKSLKEDYEKYINDPEFRRERERNLIELENDLYDAGYTEERINTMVEERSRKKVEAFKEMLPFFDSLILAATKKVSSELGIKITYYTDLIKPDEKEEQEDNLKQKDGSLNQDTDINNYDSLNTNNTDFEEIDNEEDNDNEEGGEEDDEAIGADHWVVSTANQDIHNTVNKRILKLLSHITKSTAEGYVLRDDLDNILFEDEREVFNNLLEVTANIQNVEEMIAAIEEYAANGHANYYTIIDTIIDNEELKSLFFVGLCNQRKQIESILTINKKQIVKHHNRDSKYEWIEKSVINSINQKETGTINAKNRETIARDAMMKIEKVKLNPTTSEILDLLKIVGIRLSQTDVERAIIRDDEEDRNRIIQDILNSIHRILKYCKDNQNSLASTSYYYKELASLLSDAIPISQQTMTYCDGKLYPSYNKPSFISKKFAAINSFKTLEERQAYMDKEYKQYSQYYTKNNLLDLINEAEKMNLSELKMFLEDLIEVSEKNGDSEVLSRLKSIESLTGMKKLRQQLDSLPISFRVGFWNYKWLEDAYTNIDTKFEISDLISNDSTPYTKMDEKTYLNTMFTKFKPNKSYGGMVAVTVPIYADANCWNFVYFKAENSTNKIISEFEKLMVSEINRVKCIRERDENRIKAIKEYNKKVLGLTSKIKEEKNAKKKQQLKEELKNLHLHDIKGFSYPITNYDVERELVYKKDGTIDEEKLNNIKKAQGLKYQFFDYKSENGSLKEQITEQLSEQFKSFLEYTRDLYRKTDKKGNVIYPDMPDETFLMKFYYNHCLATANILGITSQPYFYKNAVDFQKRFKEVYAMTSRLNVNVEGGRKWQRSIVLSDRILDNFKNATYKAIGNNIDKILKQSKHLSPATKKYIKRQFSQVNATDAQAIRTPSSYIAIRTMMGEWGEEAQQAWKKINTGKLDKESLKLIMGVLKPFVRSSYDIESQTNYGDIKVPIQYKNSEFMSPYGTKHASFSQTETDMILRALTDFMEDNFIDIANFESAVKVGNSAKIDLSKCTSYQEAIDELYSSTGLHKMNQEERKQLENQIKNETIDEPYIWYNKEIIKTTPYSDWGIVAPNPEHFTDKKANIGSQIRRIFQADIVDNEVYEFDVVEYEGYENYGKTNGEKKTITDKDILKEGFVTSGGTSFKKVIKKVKMKGSDIKKEYNNIISENLAKSYEKIEEIIKDNDKLAMFLDETITNDTKISDDVKQLLERDENGNFVNMADPLFTEQIHQILMSKYRNTITSQKIAGGTCVQVSCMWDDNLSLHFKEDSEGNIIVDYADCYLPCYMKSLYSYCLNDNGILDIDKLRNECIKRNDMETFEALTTMIGYRTPTEGVSSCIPLRIKGFLPPTVGSCVVLPKEITVLSGSDFDVDKLYIMRHEFTIGKDGFPKVIKSNSIKGNNNRLIDMMLNMMRTKQFTEMFLNPSGAFEDLEKSVDIIEILNSTEKGTVDIKKLKKMDSSELSDYKKTLGLKSKKNDIGMLSPQFQPYYHEQNFVGKNLLATWAVVKSAADLLQNCGLYVKKPLKYNGNVLANIAPMFVENDGTLTYLTQIIKQFLAASADNTKNPVQYKLGITQKNISAVTYLALIGLDPTSIALIIRAANMATTEDDANIDSKEIELLSKSLNDSLLAYPTKEVCAAAKFFLNNAQKTGSYLTSLISILRADSTKGALRKNIYETIEFKMKIDKIVLDFGTDRCPIAIKDGTLIDTHSIINSNKSSWELTKIGFIQRFFDYGVRAYWEDTKKIFPEFTKPFQSIFDQLGMVTKQGYLNANSIKDIIKSFYYYKVLELEFFGDEVIDIGNFTTLDDKIKSYKENMPLYFRKFVSEHLDILENEFIKRLQIRTSSIGEEIEELTFPNAFRYEKETSNNIKADFLSLFQNKDEEVRKFAWNLVKYSIYRQGFNLKGDGYGHYINRSLLSAIPGYRDLMQNIQKGEISINDFVSQFLTKKSNFTKQLPTIYNLDDIELSDGEEASLSKKGKVNAKIINWITDNYGENDTPKYVVYNKRLYDVDKLLYGDINIDHSSPISEDTSFISYTYNENNDVTAINETKAPQELIYSDTEETQKGYFENKSESTSC